MLIKRTVSGTLQRADGMPIPFAVVKFLLRHNIGYDGIVIPREKVSIKAGAEGEFECELYTIEGGYLSYRCMLPNGREFKFDLAPGGEISLDDLLNLSVLTDFDSASAALQNMLNNALIWDAAEW